MRPERRKHARFAIMHNVGEPVELNVIQNSHKISIPGFILNLSAGGMQIVTLGSQPSEIPIGSQFVLDLKLPNFTSSKSVEGTIVTIRKGEKAKLHNNNDEWFLGLIFTKIQAADVQAINQMAEDWSICETKIQLKLPDICFRECRCFDICEKAVKLKDD